MNALWRQWWRMGGVFGLGFIILFIIGPFILTGETPSRGDSVEDIRKYFQDDGEMYLVGDYIAGIAFVLFFLPYLVTLRWVLGSGEGWPPIWSWLTVIGGLSLVLVGGTSSVFLGTLAINADYAEQLDDPSVRLLMEMNTYSFTTGFGFTMSLFVGSASLVILRTGVLWRWLAALGLLAAVLLIIGAAWPIDGDEEGAIAAFGLFGSVGGALFVLISSINMLMLKEEPASTERAGPPSTIAT
jgi:hypothetical protein